MEFIMFKMNDDYTNYLTEEDEIKMKDSKVYVISVEYKADYKESAIATQSAIYYSSEPDPIDEVVVSGNVAGELASHVSSSDKANATRWTISGEINGTDIAFIREAFDNGKITY